MVNPRAQNAVTDASYALKDYLKDRLISVYIYGSLVEGIYEPYYSDINLIAIIEDEADTNLYFDVLRPIWRNYGAVLRSGPLIASQTSLTRHLELNPLFASHLRRVGQLIIGDHFNWPSVSADIMEYIAHLAKGALEISILLTPSLLSEQERNSANKLLRRVYKQIFGASLVNSHTESDLICQILLHTSARLSDFPGIFRPDLVAEGAPPLINRLLSIYEADNRLYLVFPDLLPEDFKEILGEVDWPTVSERIAGHYNEIRVTTASQLRLVLYYEQSADFRLQSYNHVWGVDILADMVVSDWNVYRSQGRLSSDLYLVDLPSNYTNTDLSDMAMLVHDYQNKLLNIQLRNELLSRIMEQDLETPSFPLPPREADTDYRLQGILDHLRWWTTYYLKKMDSSVKESKNPLQLPQRPLQ